jgi:hypothetical protein
VLSIGAAAWLFPILVVAGVSLFRRGEGRKPLLLGVLVAALVVPSLVVARFVLGAGVLGSLRNRQELGNLVAPLNPLQLAGIWPTGDFRFRPEEIGPTYALLALVAGAALVGIVFAMSRRAWEIAIYATSALGACLAFAVFGSPWLEAKAFAIASPAVIFAAILGCAALMGRGRRAEGFVALAAVATGVLWSNALAYREVNLAPREQLAELEQIGQDFAGAGPALMTEYQPYGVRHFLRKLDAEGASELRRRVVPLKDGSMLPKGGFADIGAFRPADILVYKTLVLRRSPVESRPPAAFGLVWSGRFYEVWQRTGQTIASTAVPCDSGTVVRPVPAAGEIPVVVPRSGGYDLWVGGSFRGRLDAFVDGRRVASPRHQLNHDGQYVPLTQLTLTAGSHVVDLRQKTSALRPGSGGPAWPLGPLALSPVGRCAATS